MFFIWFKDFHLLESVYYQHQIPETAEPDIKELESLLNINMLTFIEYPSN